jgi:hypothetical protein
MIQKCVRVFAPTFLTLFVSSSFAETFKFETDDYQWITKKILAKIETDGLRSGDVLLASDIDSTILTNNQVLGSERWFKWQESLTKPEVNDPQQIARSFPELLEAYGQATMLTQTHLVQPEISDSIHSLQTRGVKVICLTARGVANADATFRQLSANKLDFTDSAIGRYGGYGAPFLPYSDTVEGNGVTKADLAKLEIKNKPRPVIYARGIYFTEGQHKGLMLKTLLARTRATPKLVVFVDNEEKQVNRVIKAMEDQPSIETWSIAYTRANENPLKPAEHRALTGEEKDVATQAWRSVKTAIDGSFPQK